MAKLSADAGAVQWVIRRELTFFEPNLELHGDHVSMRQSD